jgi:hypothetical protein
METEQTQVMQSIIQCEVMLDDRDFQLPWLAKLRVKFKEEIRELQELVREQSSNKRISRKGTVVRELRLKIRSRLLRISRNAVSTLRGMPGVRDDFRLPPANAKSQLLLDECERILRNVRRHQPALNVDALLPALEANMRALARMEEEPNVQLSLRSRATRSIPDAIRKCPETVGTIEATLKDELPKTDLRHKRWKTAMRIPRKPGRPKKRGKDKDKGHSGE